MPILQIGPEVEDYQRKRLARVKEERDQGSGRRALGRVVADAEQPGVNLMPPLIDAVQAHATEGEIVAALEDVFGTYVESAGI